MPEYKNCQIIPRKVAGFDGVKYAINGEPKARTISGDVWYESVEEAKAAIDAAEEWGRKEENRRAYEAAIKYNELFVIKDGEKYTVLGPFADISFRNRASLNNWRDQHDKETGQWCAIFDEAALAEIGVKISDLPRPMPVVPG